MTKLQNTLDILNHEDMGSSLFHNWRIEVSDEVDGVAVMVCALFYFEGEKIKIREWYQCLNKDEPTISLYYGGGEKELIYKIKSLSHVQTVYVAFISEFNIAYNLSQLTKNKVNNI